MITGMRASASSLPTVAFRVLPPSAEDVKRPFHTGFNYSAGGQVCVCSCEELPRSRLAPLHRLNAITRFAFDWCRMSMFWVRIDRSRFSSVMRSW